MLFPDVIGSMREPDPAFYGSTAEMGEQHRVRYRKALFPRWGINLGWDLLTPAEGLAIDAHVRAHAGAGLRFDWYDWRLLHWVWVPIALGDGATTVFDLPGKLVADLELFTGAGTAATGTIAAGAGANGRDRVTITSGAPASGVWLWCNATMRRLFVDVRFESDRQPLTRLLDSGYYGFRTRLVGKK